MSHDSREFRAPRRPARPLPSGDSGRLPPHNPGFERAFLAAVINEGDGKIFDEARAQGLCPEWFFNTAHQTIAESMLVLRGDNCPVDSNSLPGHLAGRNELGRIGGVSYINELTDSVEVYEGMWQHWLAELKTAYIRRQVLTTVATIAESVYKPVDRRGDFNALLVPEVNRLLAYTQDDDDGRRAEDVLDTVETEFDAALAGERDPFRESRKISFGLPCLDRHFRKLSSDDGDNLIVIAATPGAGKSSLADLMTRTAICENKVVVKHALETTNKATFLSIAALDSGIPMSVAGDPDLLMQVRAKIHGTRYPVDQDLRAGVAFFDAQRTAGAEAWKKAVSIQKRWLAHFRTIRGKTFFPYDHTRKLDDIVAATRLAARTAGRMDLIVVDYLQEVRADRSNLRGDEMLGEICRTLKDLSKELRAPCVLLSTLNRSVDGGRPSMSHIRGSGDIEAAADGVITLWRPDKDEKGLENRPSDKREWCEVWAEQFNKRNRTHWREKLHFHGPLKKFKDISRETSEAERHAHHVPAPKPAAPAPQSSSDGYASEDNFEKRGRGRPKGVLNGQGAYRPHEPGFLPAPAPAPEPEDVPLFDEDGAPAE